MSLADQLKRLALPKKATAPASLLYSENEAANMDMDTVSIISFIRRKWRENATFNEEGNFTYIEEFTGSFTTSFYQSVGLRFGHVWNTAAYCCLLRL